MIKDLKEINTAVLAIRLYWKEKIPNDKFFPIKMYDQYLVFKSSPLPFLLEMNEKYPDAPDILLWLGQAWEKEQEYLKALKIYTRLSELYPKIEHYKKEIECCKVFIEYRSMPESEETLQWLRNRINEIWK